jgi:endonuclease/exonuclease/phosphatase family metal-dependent hydrolase
MIKVVSWNIELGLGIDTAIEDLTTIPELQDPDILLLQEMSPDSTRRVADELGMTFRYSAPAHHPKTSQPFGNAVLSPWPLTETTEVPLPHTAVVQGQSRAATSATVTVDGVVVVAYSIHIETVLLELRRRRRQVRTVGEHASASPSAGPVVIGGDFNSASKRSLAAFDQTLEGYGFDRLTAGDATFGRFGRPFALDHIYGRHLDLVEAGVARAAVASDHQPVWASVRPE